MSAGESCIPEEDIFFSLSRVAFLWLGSISDELKGLLVVYYWLKDAWSPRLDQ